MKKALLEKSAVVVLFVLVLIVFSFAERDSKKLVQLYTKTQLVSTKHAPDYIASGNEPEKLMGRLNKN